MNLNLDSDAFPDGEQIEIASETLLIKVVTEGLGITTEFLKTSEFEDKVYRKDSNGLIKVPGMGTGTIEATGTKVSDFTSIGTMIYGLFTKSEVRDGLVSSFESVKQEVEEDPLKILPLFVETALSAATNTSSEEYQELVAAGTDSGRRQHLASRTSTSTILTIAAGVNIVNKLPDIVLEVSVKLAKGKKILKFTKLDGLPTDVVENFRDKVKGLREKTEQFLEDFRDASQDQLRKIVELDLIESWKGIGDAAKRANPDIADAGKILRKDIKSLEVFAKFDADLISKVGQQRFDDFMTSLIKANPKCKTCGNAGSSLVGDLDDVLSDFHKVVTERAVKADGSLVDEFDDFLKEAGEQASKAKGAALTLKKMSKNWDELTQGGWSLNRFEGSIPDIETGHKLDLLFERKNPDTNRFEYKSVEMKNWSSARSISGSTYGQFKAYVTSGNGFEYYFSDGLSDAMKGNFQNVFKDASKAQELWDVNPSLFENLGFPDVDALIGAANAGQLVNHPLLNFVK